MTNILLALNEVKDNLVSQKKTIESQLDAIEKVIAFQKGANGEDKKQEKETLTNMIMKVLKGKYPAFLSPRDVGSELKKLTNRDTSHVSGIMGSLYQRKVLEAIFPDGKTANGKVYRWIPEAQN